MKVKIETTIPSARQYENIKTSYEGELTERYQMIEMAKEDLRLLNGLMKLPEGTPKWMYAPKEGEECIANGVKFTFKNNKWVYEEVK